MQVIKREKLISGQATHQDWLAIEEPPRYELIEGELCMVAAPLLPHFWVVEFIYIQLVLMDPQRTSGIILGRDGAAVRLDETSNTLIPDIFFFGKNNRPIIEEADFYGVPDFVVEVWNKDYKKKERNKKLKVYQRYGVKEYWEVFTEEKRLTVHRAPDFTSLEYQQGSNVTIQSSVIAALQLDVDAMFDFVRRNMGNQGE